MLVPLNVRYGWNVVDNTGTPSVFVAGDVMIERTRN